MASINISPTSASFGSSGGNGSVSLSVQTDSWHSEPQDGDIWMAQRKRRTDGSWNVNDWVVFRIVGETGKDGSGAVPVFQGDYSSSKSYYGDSTRRDIVKYSNQYWIARQDAPLSPFSGYNPYSGSSYWESFGASFESVATDLLFSKLTVIEKAIVRHLLTSDSGKRIQIENNVLTMFDTNGKQKLLITGEELGNLSDLLVPLSFASGVLTGNSYAINQNATLLSASSFNITSIDNTVELPEISVRINLRPSTIDDIIHAQVYLMIDGVMVVSSPSYNGVPLLSEVELVIPAKTLTLSTGTHLLQIRSEVTSDNGNLRNVDYDSGTVNITYNAEKVQIGANGFRAAFGASNYAEFIDNGSPEFIFRAGNYGLKISTSGIQKSSNMNTTTPSWTNL